MSDPEIFDGREPPGHWEEEARPEPPPPPPRTLYQLSGLRRLIKDMIARASANGQACCAKFFFKRQENRYGSDNTRLSLTDQQFYGTDPDWDEEGLYIAEFWSAAKPGDDDQVLSSAFEAFYSGSAKARVAPDLSKQRLEQITWDHSIELHQSHGRRERELMERAERAEGRETAAVETMRVLREKNVDLEKQRDVAVQGRMEAEARLEASQQDIAALLESGAQYVPLARAGAVAMLEAAFEQFGHVPMHEQSSVMYRVLSRIGAHIITIPALWTHLCHEPRGGPGDLFPLMAPDQPCPPTVLDYEDVKILARAAGFPGLGFPIGDERPICRMCEVEHAASPQREVEAVVVEEETVASAVAPAPFEPERAEREAEAARAAAEQREHQERIARAAAEAAEQATSAMREQMQSLQATVAHLAELVATQAPRPRRARKTPVARAKAVRKAKPKSKPSLKLAKRSSR